jgi:hypothetical protein
VRRKQVLSLLCQFLRMTSGKLPRQARVYINTKEINDEGLLLFEQAGW